jgi:hypothetical protein
MKKLQTNKMCTSVAIGFYIRDEEAFYEFRLKLLELQKQENCIFSVYDKTPDYMKEVDDEMDDYEVADEHNNNNSK